MQKRAQAAMEFLMTYGWAILVVLAAIGALAYFGVLNPNQLVPDQCTVNGFDCNNNIVDNTSIRLSLSNQQQVGIQDMNVTLRTNACNGIDTQQPVGTLSNRESTGVLQFNCTPGEEIVGLAEADIIVEFVKAGEEVVRTARGSLVGQPSS